MTPEPWSTRHAPAGEVPVILGLGGLADEAELVRAAAPCGLEVVRRCVDAVDLLAAAATDSHIPVVVSSGLGRLTPEVVLRLGERTVIGLAPDTLGRERLARMGVDPVIDVAPSAQVTMQQVADVCRARAERTHHRPSGHQSESVGEPLTSVTPIPAPAVPSDVDASQHRFHDDGGGAPHAPHLQSPSPRPSPSPSPSPSQTGRVIAVWGPQGAPGRTTVAIGVAEAWAHVRQRVCLVDADTYAPSITMALGLVEPTSGLAAACRHVEAGTLTVSGLSSLTIEVESHWRVLGGIERADRWSEVRPTAVERLWPLLRQAFDLIVVDTGFCLEVDGNPGAWARQRNGVATSALAQADHIIAVADASPLGAARLLAAVDDLGSPTERPTTTIVRNRAFGRGADWRTAIGPRLPGAMMHDVPDDPRVVRAAWEQGTGPRRSGARSRASRAFERLAEQVLAS